MKTSETGHIRDTSEICLLAEIMSTTPPFKILGYGHTGITVRSSKNENQKISSIVEVRKELAETNSHLMYLRWNLKVHVEIGD